MTLQSAIDAELPFLRAEAEARMLDTFVIKTPTGTTYDDDPDSPTYGDEVDVYEDLFTAKGRVKAIGAYGVEREVAGRTALEVVRELHIPVDSEWIPPKAVAFCVAVHATSDPTLLGARLTIEPVVGSQTTARRMKVTEYLPAEQPVVEPEEES